MENKLIEAKAIFEVENYKKIAMPEVVKYLREYKATGKYPYNSDVRNYINTREEVSADLQDYLDTEVYLAQQFLRDEDAQKYKNHMLAQGYTDIRDVGDFVGKCDFVGSKSMDWMTSDIKMEGKIITAGNGEPFFVPKGKRSRGYYLRNLDVGFYKPINK